MIYEPSEIIETQIEELTNILQQRFANIQIYLEGAFIREMIYLCLSGSILETIARKTLYTDTIKQPILTNLDPQGMYILSMSVMTVTSIIIGILGARYQAKTIESQRIRTSIDNILGGRVTRRDKAAIRRSVNNVKRMGGKISLDNESLSKLMSYLTNPPRSTKEA